MFLRCLRFRDLFSFRMGFDGFALVFDSVFVFVFDFGDGDADADAEGEGEGECERERGFRRVQRLLSSSVLALGLLFFFCFVLSSDLFIKFYLILESLNLIFSI